MKFQLLSILLNGIIFINATFIMLTQIGSIRQPTKLLVQIIFVLSLLSPIITVYQYLTMEKD
ncbi:hypothetical protein HMPREF9171_0923 [Streptococcus agalactiae ATCC 13813]|uniref:Uncharacterized protein n=1 Tax=Streptococcus agalactiae TaxID=1311 RepID=A0A0H1ULN6_STRAG|nr:hypothetical protein HMPREF9171_0923 [Streptococcus agalactiae ATCC 13813]EGS27785.1 hypothetical protein FSLSAGS3026_07245 [Streptococcus agalactiae FSL S3-026]EPT35080.1 hypothetical protein SAG0021_01470 [Streptococcus agalactiae FSL S3-277]EPT39855.1 hypothetical protein SAG0029_03855 [Streptococcus agalactiae FSL S3-501]EPT42383.1 hypothetical protein SAG0024_11125 [Streptococcus agalactiae FSL C1-494]EPT45362.1 hypothetical protein SAG0034_04775 [Streptococcus agalactiae FSL S3-170]E